MCSKKFKKNLFEDAINNTMIFISYINVYIFHCVFYVKALHINILIYFGGFLKFIFKVIMMDLNFMIFLVDKNTYEKKNFKLNINM